jgi:aspartate/methionine/tyrosine aminotransferase
MSDWLSPNLQHLKASETVAISAEARRRRAAGEDVLDLGVGEPDFDTPGPVAAAGIEAIEAGHTRYPPNTGIPELRRAMAGNLSRLSGGRAVDPERLVVSTGSKQALFNACFALFGPGDRIGIPSPAWVSYPQIVHLARAEPVAVPGRGRDLKVGPADLSEHLGDGARGLVLCSPCNPTGAVYSRAELESIAEWAATRGVWVIADEIYRRIHYAEGPAPSFLDLPDPLLERVVLVTGVSKAYAMTGWRIGALLAPPAVVSAVAALQSHTTTGANHPAQWAAARAYADPEVEQAVQSMVAAFRHRRDRIVERFHRDAPGVEFVDPAGAFYVFFRVDGLAPGLGGAAFCQALLREEGVALVPGAAFGDDRWVRLSYAVSETELNQALDRLLPFMARLADRAA